jgi:hypothetical protein
MSLASDRARSASPLSTPASSRYPSRKPQPVIMLAVVLGGGCGRALAVRELIRTPCQGSRHPHTAGDHAARAADRDRRGPLAAKAIIRGQDTVLGTHTSFRPGPRPCPSR